MASRSGPHELASSPRRSARHSSVDTRARRPRACLLFGDVTFADGSPLKPDARYTLATLDFLADGGDGLALMRTWPREQTGLSNLDALIAHVQTLRKPLTLPVNARRTRLH